MVCESCVKVVSFTITFLKSIGWVAVKAWRIFQVVSSVMGSRLLSFEIAFTKWHFTSLKWRVTSLKWRFTPLKWRVTLSRASFRVWCNLYFGRVRIVYFHIACPACTGMRVCQNIYYLSFCHPELSRGVSLYVMWDVSTSLCSAQHDRLYLHEIVKRGLERS